MASCHGCLPHSLFANLLKDIRAPVGREVEALVALQTSQLGVCIIRQRFDLEIGCNARRGDALG